MFGKLITVSLGAGETTKTVTVIAPSIAGTVVSLVGFYVTATAQPSVLTLNLVRPDNSRTQLFILRCPPQDSRGAFFPLRFSLEVGERLELTLTGSEGAFGGVSIL